MKKVLLMVLVMVSAVFLSATSIHVSEEQFELGTLLKLSEIDGLHIPLAADSEYVYFTNIFGADYDGSVRRVPRNLPPEQYPAESDLLFLGEDPFGIAVDSDYVYYSIHGDRGSEKLMKVAKDGGDAVVLAVLSGIRGCRHACYVEVDPTCMDPYVYFTVRDGPGGYYDPNGYVGKVLKEGGPIIELTPPNQVKHPTGIALDSDYVYFSQHNDYTEISKVSKEGGDVTTLVTGLAPTPRPTAHVNIAVDSHWVYFAEPIENGCVGKVAKNANGTTVFLTINQNIAQGVAVDEEFVYFIEKGAGNVKRVPKNGGETETLVTGLQNPPLGVIASNNQFFFTTCSDYGSNNPGGIYSFTPEIQAKLDIDPDTLNLKSNGQWVTAYITLPEGYNVEDIVAETVKIDDIPLAWWEIQDGVFMAKFDRATVQGLTNEPDYEEGTKFSELTLTITGKLTDGTLFQGTDTIRVIMK